MAIHIRSKGRGWECSGRRTKSGVSCLGAISLLSDAVVGLVFPVVDAKSFLKICTNIYFPSVLLSLKM
jgi:hypothetical protein